MSLSMNALKSQPPEVSRPPLGLWDAVSLMIGIVVGSTIFKAPAVIFSSVGGPWQALGVWAAGGVLSFCGAICYAELATTYPRLGGEYVYLTRAFGSPAGFLYGWAQLVIVQTSSLGALSYVFAEYAVNLWKLPPIWTPWLAVGAIAVLTLLNILGVHAGRITQNLLTATKLLGIGGILVAGLRFGSGDAIRHTATVPQTNYALAMILVLYAYGGWNDAAFVAAEIRHRRRNIPRALLLGIGSITLVYLLTNAAYLWALGFDGARAAPTPAADVMRLALGLRGAQLMSLLVMISALGGVNGLVYAASRVHATVGTDHSALGWLGRWNSRTGTPIVSLIMQAAIAILMVLAVGTTFGRDAVDHLRMRLGRSPVPWSDFGGGFETLVAGSAPVFWTFFLLTGLSFFVLRWRDRGIERPFAVPLYPLEPTVFCLVCGYMLYASVTYAAALLGLVLIPLAVGIPLYFVSDHRPQADMLFSPEALKTER